MISYPDLLADQSTLHDAFVAGLENMLADCGLGAFILVLANASYETSFYSALKQQLQDEYGRLLTDVEGRQHATPEDRQVFEQLAALGLDQLHAREVRQLGPWSIQFNQLRSFRPPRMSDLKIDRLGMPFDENGFHFNRAFLEKEIFWQGQINGSYCRLLYNKFPFVDYHSILVIEPEENRPQFLSRDAHEFIWKLAEALGDRLPAIGFGYNAYGAGASVNHQHFQMYLRQDAGYPVEDACWRHNGGDLDYPLDCHLATSSDSAWRLISELHDTDTTYNLIYRPGLAYIIARQFQGRFAYADWMTGMGWADVAGEVTAFNHKDYERVDQAELEKQLRAANLGNTGYN